MRAGFRGRFARSHPSWWIATIAALGCTDASGPNASAGPGTAVGPSTVERELAYAGYYGDDKGQKAWDETHATCPGALDGREMIGRAVPEWHLEQWLDGDKRTLASLRGRVVVVRFWTSPGCPFCERTLPALEKLAVEMKAEPVTFVGAFHSKPVEAYPNLGEPAKVLEKWGVHFPVALDPQWKTLQSWWYADGAHRHASSVTFVIGKDGKVLHVHPGPVFHPSDDPDESKENEDYLAVRAAIRRGLDAK